MKINNMTNITEICIKLSVIRMKTVLHNFQHKQDLNLKGHYKYKFAVITIFHI